MIGGAPARLARAGAPFELVGVGRCEGGRMPAPAEVLLIEPELVIGEG